MKPRHTSCILVIYILVGETRACYVSYDGVLIMLVMMVGGQEQNIQMFDSFLCILQSCEVFKERERERDVLRKEPGEISRVCDAQVFGGKFLSGSLFVMN